MAMTTAIDFGADVVSSTYVKREAYEVMSEFGYIYVTAGNDKKGHYPQVVLRVERKAVGADIDPTNHYKVSVKLAPPVNLAGEEVSVADADAWVVGKKVKDRLKKTAFTCTTTVGVDPTDVSTIDVVDWEEFIRKCVPALQQTLVGLRSHVGKGIGLYLRLNADGTVSVDLACDANKKKPLK